MTRRTDHHGWLSHWLADITCAVNSMTSTFESTCGYPPGVNEVRIATELDRPSSGRDREALATYGLAGFYESIGEVVLGDVGNGYFVHSAHDVLQRFVEEGPVVVAESEFGLVFASDGGGIQYVIDQRGTVHRSTTASLDTCGLDKVADSLPEFLDLVRRSVIRFASTGDPGYL